MSDKEKALDALQTIINLTTCHTMTTVNNEIIEQSEIIKSALNRLSEKVADSDRVACFYLTGQSVPIDEARMQYSPGDSMCQNCGGRCQ